MPAGRPNILWNRSIWCQAMEALARRVAARRDRRKRRTCVGAIAGEGRRSPRSSSGDVEAPWFSEPRDLHDLGAAALNGRSFERGHSIAWSDPPQGSGTAATSREAAADVLGDPRRRQPAKYSTKTPYYKGFMVGGIGIEPMTPSVSGKCSPTELTARFAFRFTNFGSISKAPSTVKRFVRTPQGARPAWRPPGRSRWKSRLRAVRGRVARTV
jgi:hypothetical protein